MRERPVVLSDMDGVMAEFHVGVIESIKREHPAINTNRSYSSFYIADDYPEIYAIAKGISDRAGFFKSLAVVEGAIEGWQLLLENGFHPKVCSAPLRSNPHSVQEKLDWLEEHFVPTFGHWVVDQAIIQKDKTLCDGIALIDDKPVITGSKSPPWQHIVFTRSYNVSKQTEFRINNWSDTRLIPMLQKLGATSLTLH